MRKSKEKFNVTKIALSVFAIGAVGTTANAQWAVTNVNDPLYFGPTGIYTQMQGHMINSAKAATDQNSALAEVARQQQLQLQEDADQRNRLAAGQLEVAKKLSEIRPTLESCAILTRAAAKAASSAASSRGSGSGGSQPPREVGKAKRGDDLREPAQNPNNLLEGPKDEKEGKAIILETRSALGTCSKKEVDAGYAGCRAASRVGVFSGTLMLPPSDISPLSLFGNTNNKQKDDEQSEYANKSIPSDKEDPEKTLEVSRAYINNLLMTNLPRTVVPADILKYNKPDLFAQYRMLQQRIESSQKPLRDILNLTIAPKKDSISKDSLAQKYWDDNKEQYKALLGMNAPEVPSMREYINFQVTNDWMGVPPKTALKGDELLKVMLERQAVNNYVAYKQLEALENINVQLATININQLAPFDYNSYRNQISDIEKQKLRDGGK